MSSSRSLHSYFLLLTFSNFLLLNSYFLHGIRRRIVSVDEFAPFGPATFPYFSLNSVKKHGSQGALRSQLKAINSCTGCQPCRLISFRTLDLPTARNIDITTAS